MGCSQIEPYPFNEKTISKNKIEDCPNIEGIYHDVGEGEKNSHCEAVTVNIYMKSCSFYRMMVDQWLSSNDEVVFEITQPSADKLNITFKNEEKQINKIEMNKEEGDYYCSEEGIVIPQADFHVDGTGMVTGTKKYILNSLEDNYLLVKRVSHAAGLGFFWVPFAGKAEGWYRWKKVNVENP